MWRYGIMMLALFIFALAGLTAGKPVFRFVDQNGDMAITVQEARSVGVARKLVTSVDMNNDGRLVKKEWESLALKASDSRTSALI